MWVSGFRPVAHRPTRPETITPRLVGVHWVGSRSRTVDTRWRGNLSPIVSTAVVYLLLVLVSTREGAQKPFYLCCSYCAKLNILQVFLLA